MNEDYSPLSLDEVDVVVETFKFQEEVECLDDHALVDEVSQLITLETFSKKTEKALSMYFKKGKLDIEGRRTLEGCYLLYYGMYMLNPEGLGDEKIALILRQN